MGLDPNGGREFKLPPSLVRASMLAGLARRGPSGHADVIAHSVNGVVFLSVEDQGGPRFGRVDQARKHRRGSFTAPTAKSRRSIDFGALMHLHGKRKANNQVDWRVYENK